EPAVAICRASVCTSASNAAAIVREYLRPDVLSRGMLGVTRPGAAELRRWRAHAQAVPRAPAAPRAGAGHDPNRIAPAHGPAAPRVAVAASRSSGSPSP